jgi:tRNA threonylcarbamoyladenosine biosynthesis protein TsaE
MADKKNQLQLEPEYQINTEDEMLAWGEALGKKLVAYPNALNVHLIGNLGVGKTTLVRGILRGFGHQGAVKSPTYTLVEAYEFPTRTLFHFDLYRLKDPEELEYMGIRDYFAKNNLCFIEWPERGGALLPVADVMIEINLNQEGRHLNLKINPKL